MWDLNVIDALLAHNAIVILVTGLVALPVTHVLYRIVYNLYFSPLKKFPGPKAWAATAIPYTRTLMQGDLMPQLMELHKKYGSVVRVTPSVLSWIDEGVWKDVWGHRQGHAEFSKTQVGRFKAPNGSYGILSADRADHARYRRLLSHEFSDRGMKVQQPVIVSYVDLLIERLHSSSSKGAQDLVQWFNWTTFDIIGRLSFGEDFDCLKSHETHPWIVAIFGNIKAVTLISGLRQLDLDWILPYITSSKDLKLREANFDLTAKKIIERSKMGSDNGDFFDNVYKHVGKDTGMTEAEIVANASNLVLAGSETTATLLSGCVYLLLRNPEKLKKVVEEIRGAFESDQEIDLFSTNKLEYTLAVLDETMRIYPPVPNQIGRDVPRGGDTVKDIWLPEGTRVQLSQFVAGHLESNFTRPEEFIPERFLGAEEFKNDNFAVFQPFSVGPRNCIGRNLAYAEMRLILAKFLYNFDIELDDRTGDWTAQKTYVLWEKHPLWVKLAPVSN